VRRRCAEVAAEASWVVLDEDRITTYADELRATGALVVDTDDTDADADPWAIDRRGGAEARAGLVLAQAAINFGSGYHPIVRKRPGLSGARTMAAGVRDWAAANPVTPARLARLSPADACSIFGQDEGDDAVGALMAGFAAALNDLGNLVLDDFDGSFVALVESAGGRAVALVDQLDRLPDFHDVSPYRGRLVPFYKRAQLAACDLHRAFGGASPAAFTDLDRLTAFADNLVPHVLRIDGVLHYDPALVARIDAGELLPPGCEEEVEIRALGVHAVERLVAALREAGTDARPCDLDLALWWRGREPRYKAVPRHRTRTTAY